MNVAESSIKRKVTTLMFVLVLAFGGYYCYWKLGWLEDPEYTIKDAMIYTYYPGATAQEVEQEVTDPLENAIQELKELKYLKKSTSLPGLSIIDALIQDKYGGDKLKQIWDQLRHKVRDNQGKLPPGAQSPIVNDDFGDVYGILYGLTAPGYTWREMKDYADFLRKKLLRVEGVAKVVYWGLQQEAVFLEISRNKVSEMGISPDVVTNAISNQNMVKPSGQVLVGSDYVWIFPTGEYEDLQAVADMLIRDTKSGIVFRVSDVATVKRGYIDPPTNLMSYNKYSDDSVENFDGTPCIGIGISARNDANVVNMGDAIKKELAVLENMRPYGMELQTIVFQGDAVKAAINGFVVNLGMAVAIVVAVLLIFMGMRCGFLIGLLLLLIVAATFVCMYVQDITLQRISLGALIIALGMLVDNGIVIADGMLVNMKRGMGKIAAANQIVNQTTLPLLGGTVVGILAFSAIGLSPDSTGEYCSSLFWVICFSMLWSWIMAITVVPLLGNMMFKDEGTSSDSTEEIKDPYDTVFYRFYRKMLYQLIRFKWLTVIIMAVLLGAAFVGFGYVDRSFFPESNQPRFYIDYWGPQGTDIRDIDKNIKQIAKHLIGNNPKTGEKNYPEVKFVSTYAGSGAPRFTLTYNSQQANPSYGFIMIEVDEMTEELVDNLFPKLRKHLKNNYPNALCQLMRFKMGASYDATIEAHFFGDDAEVLRGLTEKAMTIMHNEADAEFVQNNWRQREKVVRPQYSEERARVAGVKRDDLSNALQTTFIGTNVGLYREKNNLIPIVARPQLSDRDSVDQMYHTTVWSNIANKYIPIQQLVTGFSTEWQDTVIYRRYGQRCMTAQCEPIIGVTGPALFTKLQEKIEAIPLPTGYRLEWGGQYESSNDANAGLSKTLPISFLIMAMIVVILYSAIRQSVVVFLNVPLAMIGVTIGLLVTGVPFGFMAMLGFLSLSGMMIKNAIVLVDQIDQDRFSGKKLIDAIIDSGVTRVRPVALGAATTVLGMLPLIVDVFFNGMAVTIVFGLSFATVLTLLICPVFYAIFFRVKVED